MRKEIVVLLVVLVATMVMAQDIPFSDQNLASEESMWSLYERWRSAYTTSLDLTDKNRKFKTFIENARYINDFNKKKDMTYTLGLNKFVDMTIDEFTTMYTGAKVDTTAATVLGPLAPEAEKELLDDVPASWDWRQHGAVASVRNQSPKSMSCWAFSAVGAIEGANAIATSELLTLSEQQVLDCSGAGNCSGGWPDKGVHTGPCETNLNHAVLAVGYGTTAPGRTLTTGSSRTHGV
uniref:Cathepsin propeptide inhibitor domain-containing protein n=1 Tax=Oryza brachyantha TaxID=4533 RepID=J3N060_ORYBR